MLTLLRGRALFLVLVVVPTICAAIYFGLLASDIFISESRFLVRSPQRPVQSGLVGQLLQSSGLTRSQDDSYTVKDYILSRDALNELESTVGVRTAYSDKSIDRFNRFMGLSWDGSHEALYRYYEKHVEVEYDPVTAISVLRVHAFTAQQAYKLNSSLLDISERLVNTLNDRSRRDLISFADNEVNIASEKAKEASLALFNYRSSHSVFEPDKQAALQLEGVAKIQQDLISTEAELAQLKKLSPNNPQIPALIARSDTLRRAIDQEASKVTSATGSFSARAPNFQRLALESGFADRQLGVALATLETARSEALQKQLYLERLVQPSLPDKTREPRRLRSIFTVLMVGLTAWGVASLLVASIREHTG